MRTLLASPALLLTAACQVGPGSEAPGPRREAEELIQADRGFAAAAADRGLEGWMSVLAPDAARLELLEGTMAKGLEAIRAADAPLFANPDVRLTWTPETAHLFADQRHGLTTGRYAVNRRDASGNETVVATGRYVTWWRLSPAGTWQVIFDTGAPDPADQAP